MDSMKTAFEWVGSGALLVGLAYVMSRAVSVAHFRTKLEYLRSVLKELKEGGHDGQG